MLDWSQALYFITSIFSSLVVAVFLVKKLKSNMIKNRNQWNHTRHYGAAERYLKHERKDQNNR